MSNTVAGLDYESVTCQNCETKLTFQKATSADRRAADEFEITCHVCGHPGSYRQAHIRKSQAQYPL
jgi:RNase P subunit RPR2